jgi:hypothetical protein
MTSTLGRFYSTAVALVVFFVSWAVIAAKPWVQPRAAKPDPRLVQLQAREQRLQAQVVAANKILDKRWAAYQSALSKRKGQIKARQQLIRAQQAQQAQQVQQVQQVQQAPQVRSTPAPAPPTVRVVSVPKPATTTKTS